MSTERFKGTNEQILTASAFSILPLMLGAIVYLIHLRSINVLDSDSDLVSYVIPTTLVCIILFLGMYEILYSYKIERKASYQIKRFLIRTSLFACYMLFVLAMWYALQFFLLPMLSWKYNFLVSFFVATMLLVIVVVKIPRIRDAMAKLEKGV